MDVYIDDTTPAISGRVRPPLFYQMPLIPEFMTCYEIGDLGVNFLRACSSVEFRNYYFNEFGVRLRWRNFIKYIIFLSELAVFEYTIKTFRNQFKNFRIKMYYENNDKTKPVFEYANILSADPYVERVYYWDYYARKLNIENRDMIKILQERGFTIHTKVRDLYVEQYAEIKIFDLNND